MEAIDGVIKFVSSYPTWAKLLLIANLACIALTLTLAPRGALEAQTSTKGSGRVLRIAGVELYPNSDLAEVQVSAFVNGTEFRYPSVAGVEWLKVAPSMSGQTFRLPKADEYEIRFEMRKREGAKSRVARLVSQETVTLRDSPFAGTYRLHGLDPTSITRSGEVSAEVNFSFEVGR